MERLTHKACELSDPMERLTHKACELSDLMELRLAFPLEDVVGQRAANQLSSLGIRPGRASGGIGLDCDLRDADRLFHVADKHVVLAVRLDLP
eukprot:1194465-Prorocentrum_minimum.AAC.3